MSDLAEYRRHTPARILVGRAGVAYRTDSHLSLRADHALARDAVKAELDLPAALIEQLGLFTVQTQAHDKAEFLRRPDLGRKFNTDARQLISERCSPNADLQIVIGDGLSATAVAAQVPALLPTLIANARERGWTIGQVFAVRYCRVGVLNDIGDLLSPIVAVLLIGERPGLATAESLSAYMAYRPRIGCTDADRNLISNIHGRGISTTEAAKRIVDLASQMMARQTSGIEIKEQLGPPQLGM